MLDPYTLFRTIALLVTIPSLLIGLVLYVLRAVGQQRTARLRGVTPSFLAWLPIGRDFLLGSLADQYRYVVRGERRSRRWLLLWLDAGILAVFCAAVCRAVPLLLALPRAHTFSPIYFQQGGSAVLTLWSAFSTLSLTVSIVRYMALYDLFRSFQPGNAILSLVLSILFPGIALPIVLFVCRNQEYGMPPRKQAPPSPDGFC